MGRNEDAKVVHLMDEIRAAIIDRQPLVPPPGPPSESPPPAPRACFGRDSLIEEIVTLAESLSPVALIGAGGIGKTSTALTVLHHDRVKRRFGENRRFIRCDQFPATLAHLLNRLSKVTGAGVENPEDLTPLRPYLSSTEMIIVLDNAESILDPQGTEAKEIHGLVEELGQLPTLCLCITSRISTIPPEFETLEIPTLSMDAACLTFYRIYKYGKRSNLVDDILEQLDFHPLSITLLATVAHQNKWGADRLTREWEKRRTSVLKTQHNSSPAATIELSLTSPMFREFGPDARALLGVIAFFPRGVDENNLDWLFPTIPGGTDIFDGFCILSLTYRSDGFITMLAPLRDYLSPKDPKASPLLCATKKQYFARMSVEIDPNEPSLEESRWIMSEDVNVEHLLNIFTSIDANSGYVWKACSDFMRHLFWHKQRLTILGPRIEGLPDGHFWKPYCLAGLAMLFRSVGNYVKWDRLIAHALKLGRERGSGIEFTLSLWRLSESNWSMEHRKAEIQLMKKALEISERFSDTAEQAECLINLAYLLRDDEQFDPAEEALSRAVELFAKNGNRFMACASHFHLGKICQSKGETKKAIHHYQVALGTASSSNWHDILFRIRCSLMELSLREGGFEEAQGHVERAKLHAVNNPYSLGGAMVLQALLWYKQNRFEEARSETLRAANILEKLWNMGGMEDCRKLLHLLQERLDRPVASGQSGFSQSQGRDQKQ